MIARCAPLALLLAACREPLDAEPLWEGAGAHLMAGALAIESEAAIAGHQMEITVTGADPGTDVTLLFSRTDDKGGTCRGWSCVELDGRVLVAGRATADAAGVAVFPRDIRDGDVGRSVFVQSIGTAGGVPGKSPVLPIDVVANTIPDPPLVIVPAELHAGDAIVPEISYADVDPDGDSVTLTLAWVRDEQPAEWGAWVPAGVTRPDETWRLTATTSDGIATSAPLDMTIRVPNRLPSAVATIDPIAPVVGDVVACSWTFADADGDLEGASVARWLVDGVEVAQGPTWTVEATAGQEVACEVTPHDGRASGMPAVAARQIASNVLVLVVDDFGVDKLGLYGIDPETPPTPNIDGLAATGVVFREAWATPLCSSSRAALVTGRYGFRTGVGAGVEPSNPFTLSHDERTIAELVSEEGGGRIASAYIGKWHLATLADSYTTHPLEHGFDWHSGSMIGMGEAGYTVDGLTNTYGSWERYENGATSRETRWPDSSHVDDAIARVDAMPEPWAMIVGFAAGHRPYHDPPAHLHSGPPLGAILQTQQYHAAIESLDTEIGRLLAGIPADVLARTTIVLLGDNGTKEVVVSPLWDPDRQKKTLYQGGVHVPLIVSGPLVREPGREVDAIVSIVDLFPTMADALGLGLPDDRELDGTSLVPYLADPEQAPLRETVYSELFEPAGFGPYDYHEQAIRDARWKVIRFEGHDELYDMSGAVVEGTDLLADGVLTVEEQLAYDTLVAQLPCP